MANRNGTISVGKCSAVVVYERASGNIVHAHECWVEKGARSPSKRTLAAEAMAYAKEGRELSSRSVGILHVDPKVLEISASETLRVDVKRKRVQRLKVAAKGRMALR